MSVTTKDLAIKRIKYLIGAILLTAVAPELINGGAFEWATVRQASEVALGYWLLTTFSDWRNPDIPNK